jgi:hypothetical protein
MEESSGSHSASSSSSCKLSNPAAAFSQVLIENAANVSES